MSILFLIIYAIALVKLLFVTPLLPPYETMDFGAHNFIPFMATGNYIEDALSHHASITKMITYILEMIVLGIPAGFLDFLPFLGTGIIITPWAIYCALTGDYLSVVVLVITYFVSLLAHRLLEPKLVSDNIGMSPFATLLSMFIGYRLIGVLGLIVGIPVGMIVVAFVDL